MSAYEEEMKNLEAKLGNQDKLIALSTVALQPCGEGKPRPAARLVDAVYEDGSFYITTYATANKMLEIEQNPNVAVCIIVESFTADGVAENLGWVRDEKNAKIMVKVREIFKEWYTKANNDADPNTCLLRVRLIKGLWNNPHEGTRTEIDFINKTVQS